MAPSDHADKRRRASPRPAGESLYVGVTRLFSVIMIGFGLAIVVVTLVNGGGPVSTGFLLGLLFTAIGVARLYIALRPRS